ncbi:peptidoglycan recognition protein 1 [Perognathus longimembris pacificus]|uniref:peptidoglycan recognition protein 1 n=1 Tax=Perognathus longimembris pacificus TaxID=214514 RepID=UPI002018FD0E|nr:peptidoglycan recognition protein 1 [Perognathus longimembris pacificus]
MPSSYMLLACALLALLGLGSGCSLTVPRREWGALVSKCSEPLQLPAHYVVISHTAGSTCSSPALCEKQAQNIQSYHMRSLNWCDVSYNFLIGEDGHVYEGRGWHTKGAHSGSAWNPISIGISFMGNYMERMPPPRSFRALQNLLDCGVAQGFLRPKYQLKGHRDVQKTQSPGDQLYNAIRQLQHYHE